MKKLIILAAVALMTGSCGIYGKYKPAKEAPEELYGDIAATGDTTSFGDLTWREVFTDPYLSELIDTALVRNSDIRTARLKVEEAQASLLTAKLSYLPSLALTPEGGITTFDGTVTKTYTAPVSASWEIDLFGRVTNAKRQAKALLEQSKDYEQAVKTECPKIQDPIAQIYWQRIEALHTPWRIRLSVWAKKTFPSVKFR